MFLLNVWIIFNTFLFAEIFRRRRGVRWVIGILWVVLGIVNYIVQRTAVLPLTTRDVLLIPDGMRMITVYFTWYEIVGHFSAAARCSLPAWCCWWSRAVRAGRSTAWPA